MVRIVFGFAVAALWLPIVAYATGGVYGWFWSSMTGIFTIPLTIVLAVPVFYVWRRRITFWRCLTAGLAVGLVGALLFLLMTNPLAALHSLPAFVLAGTFSSTLFWVVAVWNNKVVGELGHAGGKAAI